MAEGRVPDWFAKLVIAAMATIALGLGGWAMNRVDGHEGRIIKIETRGEATEQYMKEIRQDIKDIKMELQKRP